MKILRKKAVCEKLGDINETTLWRISRGDPTFPVSIQLNKRVVGWLEHEIDAWLEQKAAAARSASNNAVYP
ncbi:AlpA family phage regulatory protein (plasmid) [Pseudomonas aeruginosa]|uniref:helix-turn-helix transcriptional regulator n=1 Tax=Pseudomonas aeruginosa TaxID=287 RepID=UPI000795776A|nr:AlpA family phage regulatory protein [Pseudomonas aeruginosa]KWZ71659.1 AlpA family transcriptional regulator [Pseudomonas aeruginosa]MBW5459819.1 AlpA family phage regulatory protein [Pseudomonas aeruginosa]MCH0742628.1 AlpA family phage regulatory protein [Pseudomonas aeruginosa]PTZ29728.1 AlpA family transcriptional regulator [Pseudomonas aeruginosa]RWY56221.1 AlpA family phage regulatory protein [Pseudomonas aeruginosa]